MKNIHVLPTNKPSRVYLDSKNSICITDIEMKCGNTVNIYITSDEEIKDVIPHKGKWHLEKENILNKFPNYLTDLSECKLVIMTTNQDLIKDGVQAINDEFLEWFVKNPSCEFAHLGFKSIIGDSETKTTYKIIIPKEEPKQICNNCKKEISKYGCACGEKPKQETLEEIAEKYANHQLTGISDKTSKFECINDFIAGAKWQQEQNKNLYSEEEVMEMFHNLSMYLPLHYEMLAIEMFKKK